MDKAKDYFQILAWIVASVGGVVAAFRAIFEMQLNRKQRQIELRWRQACEAKEILEKLQTDTRSRNAMQMLDWGSRTYRIWESETGKSRDERIKKDEVLIALRVKDLKFNSKEAFVRDCFDHLFDRLERINHFIFISLINFTDIEAPLGYYVCLLAKDKATFKLFMEKYDFTGTLDFCNRYSEWRGS